jgi:hypothetical protein
VSAILLTVGLIAFVAGAIYLSRRGYSAESPSRLVGAEVQAFFPHLKPAAGWLSPAARVSALADGWYVIQFSESWTTEFGLLETIWVRSSKPDVPLSRLAVARPGTLSIPIVAKLKDGREVALELGAGYESPDA